MEVVTKAGFVNDQTRYLRLIKQGALFIHPTDTIYGLGCDATNKKAVAKIREVKNRNNNPFSVIAPSKQWILSHCEVSPAHNAWLDKLPGAYTLIFTLKNPACIAPNVNPAKQTLGVRIPDHWFSQAVQQLGRPVITTSANKTGQDFMNSLETLDPEIQRYTNFIVYEGKKQGKPSTVVDLTTKKPVVLRG